MQGLSELVGKDSLECGDLSPLSFKLVVPGWTDAGMKSRTGMDSQVKSPGTTLQGDSSEQAEKESDDQSSHSIRLLVYGLPHKPLNHWGEPGGD